MKTPNEDFLATILPRPADKEAFVGSYPQIILCAPQILLCSEKIVSNI